MAEIARQPAHERIDVSHVREELLSIHLFVAAAGRGCAVLGLLVLVAWHVQGLTPERISSLFRAVHYDTAVSLVLCGVGLGSLAAGRKGLATACGGTVALLGLCLVAQTLAGIEVDLGTVFLRPESPVPGFGFGPSGEPSAAVCSLLSGLGLVVVGIRPFRDVRNDILGVTGAATVALAGTELVSCVAGWLLHGRLWTANGLAAPSAFSFSLFGVASVASAWQRSAGKLRCWPRWFSASVCLATIVASLAFSRILLRQQDAATQRFLDSASSADLPAAGTSGPQVTVVFGLLLSGALTTAAQLGQASNAHAQRLQKDNEKLRKLIAENRAAKEALGRAKLDLERRLEETSSASERQACDLKTSHNELEQFAHRACRHLRELLRRVESYSRLLEKGHKGTADKNARKLFTFISEGTEELCNLMNAVLEYSRVATTRTAFMLVNCETILDCVLANLQARVAATHTVVDVDPLPEVFADGLRLGQLFQNLIENAIQFRGNDAARVHISAREGTSGEWIFSVQDDGIGIDEHFQARIFEPLQSLASGYHGTSTGMGLAICRRILEQHDGRIWVESVPGEGTTFYFALPRPLFSTASDVGFLPDQDVSLPASPTRESEECLVPPLQEEPPPPRDAGPRLP